MDLQFLLVYAQYILRKNKNTPPLRRRNEKKCALNGFLADKYLMCYNFNGRKIIKDDTPSLMG